MLAYILLFTFLGGIGSLAGSFFLLAKKQLTEVFADRLVSFAAGVLIATAFLDLLPEAQELDGESNIFLFALIGFVMFFLAERFLRLFHFHHGHGEKPTNLLILVGDGVHNFVDGVTIAVAFLTNMSLGITTSFAVAAHEIPQEIADMGVLLANGLTKTKALIYNFLSALTAISGALSAYFFADFIEKNIAIFLALAAGHFIYISASDLIPDLHEKIIEGKKVTQAAIFLLGIISVLIFTKIFEG
ncbi:ZIP family metal transporter [Candidatus Curtissbacteria bacterium]|nr:ZIP family metal transporter [Candidatus Curtissbacteria bacterium]